MTVLEEVDRALLWWAAVVLVCAGVSSLKGVSGRVDVLLVAAHVEEDAILAAREAPKSRAP